MHSQGGLHGFPHTFFFYFMKTSLLITLAIIIAVLVSPIQTYAIEDCPQNTPGCTNWDSTQAYPIFIKMNDGAYCQAVVWACRRCCSGRPEFFVKEIIIVSDCETSHGGYDPTNSELHDQIVKKFIESSNYLCGSTILPCSEENQTIFAKVYYAQCYKWGIPTYNITYGDYTRSLIPCSTEIGCCEDYKVCWDGTQYVYTYVGQSYSAICPPNSSGCFSICR